MKDVYITALGTHLPGPPVQNSEIETILGMLGGRRSRNRALVLKQNRIKTRHYALDQTGQPTSSNAEMAALAVSDALLKSEVTAQDIDLLCSATTLGDVLLPGIASHVQANLGFGPIEIASFQSVCASAMMAIKTAWLHLKSGEHACAIATGSEFASRYLKASFFEQTQAVQRDGRIPMESDFLRFTLSDGAGAAVLENRPNEQGLSLKIRWIDIRSDAQRFETCMVGGQSDPASDGQPSQFWGDYASPADAAHDGALVLRQDFAALKRMMAVWTAHYLDLIDKKQLDISAIDHVCSHYSAHSLRVEAMEMLDKAGALILPERWFSNIYTKGNTGSASIFMLLEELFYSGTLEAGQTILCHVPESGRCLNALMLLEVVR
ncbi:MAG: beta-ketoacyl-ACP synthase III [Alphaproteobacteria bacterium]